MNCERESVRAKDHAPIGIEKIQPRLDQERGEPGDYGGHKQSLQSELKNRRIDRFGRS